MGVLPQLAAWIQPPGSSFRIWRSPGHQPSGWPRLIWGLSCQYCRNIPSTSHIRDSHPAFIRIRPRVAREQGGWNVKRRSLPCKMVRKVERRKEITQSVNMRFCINLCFGLKGKMDSKKKCGFSKSCQVIRNAYRVMQISDLSFRDLIYLFSISDTSDACKKI